MNITLIVAPLRKLGLEDTRSVIHRTTLQTGEWQHHGMIRYRTAKCFVLCTTCTLVTNQVRPGAADTSRTGCLMSIHHDMMLGCSLDDTLVVIVHQLAVVILTSWDDIADITGLHGIITIFVHQVEGIFQVALVEEMKSLLEKAGYEVIFPENRESLCCGTIWESKGMADIAERKVRELEEALYKASCGGRYPVVCDQSPCLNRMKQCITKVKLYDSAEFIWEFLREKLEFHQINEPIALHVTCSTKHMKLSRMVRKVSFA